MNKDTVYIVTGVGGFIGLEIAAQLCAKGCAVRGLVRKISKDIPYPENIQLIVGDLLDPQSLEKLYEGIGAQRTVFIHSAAYLSVRKKDLYCERVNIEGTQNILDLCWKYNSKLIFLSSVDVLNSKAAIITEPDYYDTNNHETSYAYSKAFSSQLVVQAHEKGMDCTILLPSAVAGPNDYRKGFITDLLAIYQAGITIFSIKGGYDFVDVRDVAKAAVHAAQNNTPRLSYILSNKYVEIIEIYEILARHKNKRKPIIALSLKMLYPVIPLMAIYSFLRKKENPLTASSLLLMGRLPQYSNARAVNDLNFKPRPTSETFKDTIDFLHSIK